MADFFYVTKLFFFEKECTKILSSVREEEGDTKRKTYGAKKIFPRADGLGCAYKSESSEFSVGSASLS